MLQCRPVARVLVLAEPRKHAAELCSRISEGGHPLYIDGASLLLLAAGDEVTPEDRSVLHTVGAAGLVAFVDVYDSLEQAAK